MSEMGVKGFKVFNPDWTCRDKQYTCPGKYEETVTPSVCDKGMHFCKKAADCFDYYSLNSKNKVAEVIAYGIIAEEGNKCCTDRLKIVRELSWQEVLEIVNIGKNCTGLRNTGNYNTGNRNTGDCNTGDCNTGNYNTGNRNTGDCNTGDCNTGDCNTGDCNTGDCNTGNRNTGDWNTGHWNTGNRNTGDCNTGDCNTGNRNTGDWNTGHCNTGDWNSSSFNTGCFMTEEQKIEMFNRPSEWTYRDWLKSDARYVLNQIPKEVIKWISSEDMTEDEKTAHPEAETTGGYLKVLEESESTQVWWNGLAKGQKQAILEIPNFDAEIFREITGIRTDG